MPVSKRSAKRRAKLKKRGDNTYSWAVRKVMTFTPEELEQLIAESEARAEQLKAGEQDDVQG